MDIDNTVLRPAGTHRNEGLSGGRDLHPHQLKIPCLIPNFRQGLIVSDYQMDSARPGEQGQKHSQVDSDGKPAALEAKAPLADTVS